MRTQTTDGNEPSVADQTTRFDQAELDVAVGDIGRYLAELKYIDDALSYLESMHSSRSAGPAPAYHTLEVTLGTTYPFTASAGKHGTPFDEAAVAGVLAERSEAARSFVINEMDALLSWIRPMTQPDVAAYDSVGDSLGAALEGGLSGLLFDVDTSFGAFSDNLAFWEGNAADDFKEGFRDAFPLARERQLLLVAALVAALADSKAIAQWSQHSLMNIVIATRDAVEEQLVQRQRRTEEMSSKDAFSIAAAGVAILSLPAMAVPALGVTLQAAAAAMSAAAVMLPEEAVPAKIEGQTADQLLVAFERAVREVKNYVDKEHEALRIHLSDLQRKVDDMVEHDELVPKRPDLVDHRDNENLGDDLYNISPPRP